MRNCVGPQITIGLQGVGGEEPAAVFAGLLVGASRVSSILAMYPGQKSGPFDITAPYEYNRGRSHLQGPGP
jgi:hypothetical protein